MNLYRFMKRLTVSASVLAAANFSGCISDNTKTAAKADDTAASLVLAENGKTDYQIVIPDKGKEEIVDNWLFAAAKLMQAAFEKNGFKIDVVQEGAKAKEKPGIYLGATRFAKESGINVEQHDDWTYFQKAVGRDLIIAGNDKKDPVKTIDRTKTPLALLGTVKGVCDFLREYAGVRFLFMNMDQSQYATRGGGLATFNKDGSLNIDTRSIAFIPVKKIAVPKQLDLEKTPMLRANCDNNCETFYYISMNFFPMLSFVQEGNVGWPPATEYAKSHPEYFALTKDGKRACDLRPHDAYAMAVCPSGGAQDLVYAEAEKLMAGGAKTISISVIDVYGLCQCNCEECNKLFGMKAENWEQIYARGASGKLWHVYLKITERLRKKYPDVKICILAYQDNPTSGAIEKEIKEFPKNVMVGMLFASQRYFDVQKISFPAGIYGLEETFTSFGRAGSYLPERTPEHMAEFVQTLARNNVKWSTRDGVLGYVRGMQAPAYYVYGRMMDDPAADWKAIYKEFCTAAFGNVEPQMTKFFDLLHMQMVVYSEFLGVCMPGWGPKCSFSPYNDSKWHVMSMYTPEYCADADALLASAEKAAKDPDVQARLHLIRIEFDYIRKMSKIFFLQNAWTLNSTQANLDQLLDAIDDWHSYLEKLAGGTGRSGFKPLSDWPEMRPFNGNFYVHAALVGDGYRQLWSNTCLNWDTKAIRAGILTDKHQLKVATVEAAPGIDSKEWDNVTESVLKARGSMPFINARTTLKVLRDKDALYVRLEGPNLSSHPEDLFKIEPDGNIFTQEYDELGILPPDSGGKVYRLAANPLEGSRYDSVFTPDKNNRMIEDVKWNGKWEVTIRTTGIKGPWNLGERIWTAWFRIPFTDFGGRAPAAGEVWRFNAARNRYLWSDGPGVTDSKTLGELVF